MWQKNVGNKTKTAK